MQAPPLKKAFYLATLGCQMNVYDSEGLAQELLRSGYTPVSRPDRADIILLNTCTVRAKVDQKVLSALGRMIRIKKRRPEVILGLLGCYAQAQGGALMERFPALDIVAGPREIGQFLGQLLRVEEERAKIVATRLNAYPSSRLVDCEYFRGKVRAQITIMQGCDNFCAYCIVPYVRGREISRPPWEIRREAESLVSAGVQEITLLGQNVNSYRWSEGVRWDFGRLLRDLSTVKGLRRLRFTTSHPKDLSDDLISCFREVKNLCAHIHLPFQAGSNSVLERMGRGYTRETYLVLAHRLREARPEIAISSDVMVGFPGESEEDFQETLDLIQAVRFDMLFSFKYSDREGTVAYHMGPKVEETEKARRLERLQALQRQITLESNRAAEGKELEVLVEGESRKGAQLTGRTSTNKTVNFTGNSKMIGNLIKVKIKRGNTNSLWGELPSHP